MIIWSSLKQIHMPYFTTEFTTMKLEYQILLDFQQWIHIMNSCAALRMKFGKSSPQATVFSVFSRIQENTLAKPFQVCQLPFPEPSSPKSPSILMQPCGDSTEH